MKFIKIDEINVDNFEVLDEDNNEITGLVTGDFTIELYNPSGTEVSGSISVIISELQNGLYRVLFTPNVVGIWFLVLYHSTYFPYGKANDYQCYENDIDDLALEATVQDIKTETDKMNFIGDDIKATLDGEEVDIGSVKGSSVANIDDFKADVSLLATSAEISTLSSLVTRVLGLVQENFRIFNPTYNSSHLLTSATIKIYPSATDCNNDTNAITTYSMTASYNSEGEMTAYKVIKN